MTLEFQFLISLFAFPCVLLPLLRTHWHFVVQKYIFSHRIQVIVSLNHRLRWIRLYVNDRECFVRWIYAFQCEICFKSTEAHWTAANFPSEYNVGEVKGLSLSVTPVQRVCWQNVFPVRFNLLCSTPLDAELRNLLWLRTENTMSLYRVFLVPPSSGWGDRGFVSPSFKTKAKKSVFAPVRFHIHYLGKFDVVDKKDVCSVHVCLF